MLDISGMIQLSERELTRLQTFDPESGKAGRNQVIESIIRRRGHPAFRQQLLAAYEYRCAITNFNALDALEATYIVPVPRQVHPPPLQRAAAARRTCTRCSTSARWPSTPAT